MPINDVPFQTWRFPNGRPWAEFFRIETGYLVRFPEMADFTISADGLEVHCHPIKDVSLSIIEHLYLNQILPLALSRRGELVFHASAVGVANVAIAFLGASGRGKSTLAASFAANGMPFLTDDGLLLNSSHKGYDVQPSQPSIRLWEDSAENILPTIRQAEPGLAFTSKSRFLAGSEIRFSAESKPLHGIFVLSDEEVNEISIRRLSAREAFLDLTRHAFMLDIEDGSFLCSHFDGVTKISNSVACYQLDYPRSFNSLDDLREMLIEHTSRKQDTR